MSFGGLFSMPAAGSCCAKNSKLKSARKELFIQVGIYVNTVRRAVNRALVGNLNPPTEEEINLKELEISNLPGDILERLQGIACTVGIVKTSTLVSVVNDAVLANNVSKVKSVRLVATSLKHVFDCYTHEHMKEIKRREKKNIEASAAAGASPIPPLQAEDEDSDFESVKA